MGDITIKKAALINFISRYAALFVQIIYGAILARILRPEDFGVVAIITVFITFFMMFSEMGIGTAIIQNKTITDEDLNNIFSFTVYMGILLALLFALFSIPLAIFFENEVYKPIGVILSISLFLSTLNIVPNAILLKNKRFKTIGLRLIVVSILSSILTIILALLGFRYYAIVIYAVIMEVSIFIWNYKSVHLKASLKFDKNSIIKIKEFSIFQLSFNLVNYFSRNLDNLLIGKFMGNSALAYYDKGYKLMLYPVGNLTNVITPVLLPILSEHQDEKDYIYSQYLKVAKIISLLGVFITVYCFFAAKEIILIMFGQQWLKSVPCFQLLALSVWPQMITASSGTIFQILGKTRLLFITGICSTFVSVTAIIIGISFHDITKMALCVAIAYNLHFFIAYYVLINYGFGYKFQAFLKTIVPDGAIYLMMMASLYVASFYRVENVFLAALFKGIVGGGAYVAGLLLTKQYKIFSVLVKRKVRQKVGVY